jgi:hypothetical protein
MTNLGDAPADVTSAQGVVGANMIFGTRALRDVGGFSGDLGRKGAILLSNDELHVKFLLEQKGLKSVYHPQVGVSHHAASARLTKRWFRRRLYWQGRSDAIWWHHQNDASLSSRAAEAITAAILMAKHAAHWLRIARPKDCARSAFASECHLLSRVGYIVGLAKGNGARSLD